MPLVNRSDRNILDKIVGVSSSAGLLLRNEEIQATNKSKGFTSWRVQSIIATATLPSAIVVEQTIAEGMPATNGINRITFPSGLTTMAIASTSANDEIGENGAHRVEIFGLDTNYNEISTEAILLGLLTVQLNIDFLRINKIKVTTTGSTGFNEGDIYIGASSDTFIGGIPNNDIFGVIGVGSNISRMGIYTVPNNRTLYETNGLVINYHRLY